MDKEALKRFNEQSKMICYIVASCADISGAQWQFSPLFTNSNRAYAVYNRLLNMGVCVELLEFTLSKKFFTKHD